MRSHQTTPPTTTATASPAAKPKSKAAGLGRVPTVAMAVSIPIGVLALAFLFFRLHRHARSSRMQHVDHIAGTSKHPVDHDRSESLRAFELQNTHQPYPPDDSGRAKEGYEFYERDPREDEWQGGIPPHLQELERARRVRDPPAQELERNRWAPDPPVQEVERSRWAPYPPVQEVERSQWAPSSPLQELERSRRSNMGYHDRSTNYGDR